jgi:RNA polymerase sigma-70 factor (ECF subfamily)
MSVWCRDASCRREVRELFGRLEHPCVVKDLSPSDAALVARAAGGEVEALAGLLERYRPSLYAAAIGLLRNREEAADAVQDTCLTAIMRLGSLRDPTAIGGWLHAVLRNTCLMRVRRAGRETPDHHVEIPTVVPGPEDVIDEHALRDWVWAALESLDPDDRVAVMLRYFTRCRTYHSIAAVTGVPVGTVRSRLHRARSQLNGTLTRGLTGSPLSHADLERATREAWEGFYAELHESPVPRTYQDAYSPDVEVTDQVGWWRGIEDWSAHEREAIDLGVRARIIDVVASANVTVLEIDFTNPSWASDHCPPRSTFVHRMSGGRSRRLDITYVGTEDQG